MSDEPIPFRKPLAGKTPRLISTNGEYLKTTPPADPSKPAGVVIQGPGTAPIPSDPTGAVHWPDALACLKELVHDIETGRLSPPTAVYVAMLVQKPDDPTRIAYPSYVWTGDMKHSRLVVGALLEHHKLSLLY